MWASAPTRTKGGRADVGIGPYRGDDVLPISMLPKANSLSTIHSAFLKGQFSYYFLIEIFNFY